MRLGDDLPAFISKAFSKSFIYFAKFIWGKSNYFFLSFAKIHYFIEKIILAFKKQITVVSVPRGYGKSKFISVLFTIYAVFILKRKYILLISHSQERSLENLNDIIKLIESENFNKYFKWHKGRSWRPSKPSGLIEIDILDRNGNLKYTSCIRACGVFMDLTGASRGENRPDLEIWDDLEDPLKAVIQNQVDKLQDWINKIALPGLSKRDRDGRTGQVIWIGTPHGSGCMLDRAMSKKWQRDVAIVKIPAITDFKLMTNELIAFLGLPEGVSVWPEMISTTKILQIKDDFTQRGALAEFMLEYQMDSSITKKLRFDHEHNKIISKQEVSKILPDCLRIVCIIDMAYTQQTYSDYVGINVTAHFKKSKMVVLLGEKKKLNTIELHNYCLQLYKEYEPYWDRFSFYAESLQIQLLQSFWDEKNIRADIAIEIFPISTNTKLNKVNRIIRLTSYHKTGMIDFVEDDCVPLLGEMAVWDGSKGVSKRVGVDDALDAFAYQVDFTEASQLKDMNYEPEKIQKKILTNKDITDRYYKDQEAKKYRRINDFFNGF